MSQLVKTCIQALLVAVVAVSAASALGWIRRGQRCDKAASAR